MVIPKNVTKEIKIYNITYNIEQYRGNYNIGKINKNMFNAKNILKLGAPIIFSSLIFGLTMPKST